MAIIVFDQEKFTEAAKETMAHMTYYVNESQPVVLLAENVAVLVNGKSTDQDEILDASSMQVADVLGSSPDFANYVMDDDCGIVVLTNGDVLTFIPKEEVNGMEEIPLGMALVCRGAGIAACEENNVIAMFIPD